ncbi:MAG: DHH family phosphoesterase [Bacilli bacterium]|nr:DHH family phosphoesterase [Bacilli bacterium]
MATENVAIFCKMKDLFHRLLDYYSITELDFDSLNKDVNPQSFVNEYRFNNIKEAVELVNNAIKCNKKIHIYGDYDADGIMGVSILVKMFDYLNYEVTYCVPSRYKDGYGINMPKAEQMVKDNIGLCICVDNGISAVEPIKYLRENNIDVLVLDHHEAPEALPNANVILHPFLSKLSEFSTSGASVAFLFSVYVLKHFDKYLSTLASISIISDMMPLKGYNRDLLRIVFSNYKEGEFYPVDLLKGNDPFDENSIGMSIAPKINSVGRIIEDSTINNIIKFFTSSSKEDVLTYYNWINELNLQRKEASKSLLNGDIEISNDDNSIVIQVDEKEGLIGLIANSLMSKYKKPAIVFTYNPEQDLLKGSCRSQEGFNVVEAFDNLKDLMIAYGGHSLAGGCSIKKENFNEFKKRFNNFAIKHPVIKAEKPSIPLLITEVTFETFELISKFGPFGEEWKKPIFNLENIRVGSLKYSKDLNHIITQIGTNSKITGFNISKEMLFGKDVVDFLGTLRVSTYKSIKSIEFLISEIK